MASQDWVLIVGGISGIVSLLLAAVRINPYVLTAPYICSNCKNTLADARQDLSHWLNPERIQREDLEAVEKGWISNRTYQRNKKLLESALQEAGNEGSLADCEPSKIVPTKENCNGS